MKGTVVKIAIMGHKRIPSHEGGIEKGVEQHAVRMAALGHEVTVYNRGGHNVFGKEYDGAKLKRYKGVNIVTIPTIQGPLGVPLYSFLAVLHAALIRRCDVLSIRASGPCAMTPLAKLLGLRVVASLHGLDSQRDKWGGFASKYLAFGERMAATKADVCLVLSRNMKEYIESRYHARAVLFANGIDAPVKVDCQDIHQRFDLEPNDYILSLGRIVPEKGIHYLIQAFRECSTDKKLIIAGGAEANKEYYESLQKLAEGDSRIRFIGYVTGNTIAELYSNAYVFALPSNLEGMANALLEAMSYGNCCLVSDIPENTEVVSDHAVVFRKGDVQDLQRRLQNLLDSPDLVAAYKNGAAPFILSRYSWDTVVEQMLDVYAGNVVSYQEVLNRHVNEGTTE